MEPMGIKIHPRTLLVQEARAKIGEAVFNIGHDMKLTSREQMMILSELLLMTAKWCVQRERHPGEPDKATDEA